MHSHRILKTQGHEVLSCDRLGNRVTKPPTMRNLGDNDGIASRWNSPRPLLSAPGLSHPHLRSDSFLILLILVSAASAAVLLPLFPALSVSLSHSWSTLGSSFLRQILHHHHSLLLECLWVSQQPRSSA